MGAQFHARLVDTPLAYLINQSPGNTSRREKCFTLHGFACRLLSLLLGRLLYLAKIRSRVGSSLLSGPGSVVILAGTARGIYRYSLFYSCILLLVQDAVLLGHNCGCGSGVGLRDFHLNRRELEFIVFWRPRN